MAKRIQVDIISDTVCPWCYLGKRRLETAIKRYQEKHGPTEIQVNWHPYQLNPTASEEGVNKKQFYQEKFGAALEGKLPQMKADFAKEGLQYTIDGLIGNSFNSHRLISYAGKHGPEKQNAVVENIFKAYFTEAKFINDKSVLLAAADAAGIPAKGVVEDKTLQATEVKAEVNRYKMQINGVPHFTINKKYSISGAQDPETFLSIFEEV